MVGHVVPEAAELERVDALHPRDLEEHEERHRDRQDPVADHARDDPRHLRARQKVRPGGAIALPHMGRGIDEDRDAGGDVLV